MCVVEELPRTLGATTFFVSQAAPGVSAGSTKPTSYTQTHLVRPEYKVLGCTLGERSLNIISQGEDPTSCLVMGLSSSGFVVSNSGESWRAAVK